MSKNSTENYTFGQEVDIDSHIKETIEKFNNDLKKNSNEIIDENVKELTEKNVIDSTGISCARGLGVLVNLVNTDRKNRYEVTIKKYTSNGRTYSNRTYSIIMNAGSARRLGCQISGYETVRYTVEGETKL